MREGTDKLFCKRAGVTRMPHAGSLSTNFSAVKEAVGLCVEVEGSSTAGPKFVGVQRVAVEI